MRLILPMGVLETLVKTEGSAPIYHQVSDSLAPAHKAGTETRARRTPITGVLIIPVKMAHVKTRLKASAPTIVFVRMDGEETTATSIQIMAAKVLTLAATEAPARMRPALEPSLVFALRAGTGTHVTRIF